MAITPDNLKVLAEELVKEYDAAKTPDKYLEGQELEELTRGRAAIFIRYLGRMSEEETLRLLQAWSSRFSWISTVTVDDLLAIHTAMDEMYDNVR